METEQTKSRLDQIESSLCELIVGLEPTEPGPSGPGRPRVLPALCLWAGVIVCVLRGWSSQLAIWRLLTTTGLWHYPRLNISDQAVYNRLAQGGDEPLRQLFLLVSQVMAVRLSSFRQELASFCQRSSGD